MPVEHEVKLSAPPGFELPDLTVTAAGLPVAVLPEQRLTAVYYDTDDLRLARWGVTARHRAGEAGPAWTVKLPIDTNGAAVTRQELRFAGSHATIPADLLHLLRAYVRTAVLVPVARLVTRRRRVEVRGGDGHALVEVDDDEVSVLDGRRVAGRFREIEVEVRDGAEIALLDAVVARLREAGAASATGSPKLVQALGGRALAPPEVPVVALDDGVPAGRVVQAAIAAGVTRLLHHDPGVRLGDDPEDVHQARVGTRRLRSDLRTFRALVDPEWSEGIRDELKWIAAELGTVRDADVLLERLQRQSRALGDEDARAAHTLLRRLSAERDVARESLMAAMSSDRYVEMVERLVGAAAVPRLTPEADEKAAVVLPDLVAKPWRHLERQVGGLGPEPVDEALHEVRIRAKRARYAAEAAAPVIGKPARRLAAAIAEVQGVLGDLQDGAVAEQWLRRAAATARGGPALAAGQLVAAQRREMASARKAWKPAWSSASRGRSCVTGSADGTVRAAGGVVWRRGDGGLEVLVVHRPKYDDWSLPKGKCDPGEDDLTCGLREVEEETGLRARPGAELPTVTYRDSKGRPKVVRYWAMAPLGGAFEAGDEVDEVRWLPLDAAARRLDYDHDRQVVAALPSALEH